MTTVAFLARAWSCYYEYERIFMSEEQHTFDDARHDAPEHDTSRHTLTIKQASRMFASLGVPRSPRSVQRFCVLGNIDCLLMKGEKTERYFVNEESVERYARELEHMEHISAIAAEEDTTRHDAPERDTSRNDTPRRDAAQAVAPTPTPSAESNPEVATLKSRVDELEKEKIQLAIDRAAKEMVINQMLDQQREWVDRLDNQGRQIGRLEMQVQQLAAPKSDESRHDAPAQDDVVTARFVEVANAPVSTVDATATPVAPSLPTKRSTWQRMFG